MRLPLRLGGDVRASASRAPRRAQLWPVLQDQPGVLPRALDGTPRGGESPVGARRGGRRRPGGGRRGRRPTACSTEADELEDEQPTYFGSALVALARTAWKPGGC